MNTSTTNYLSKEKYRWYSSFVIAICMLFFANAAHAQQRVNLAPLVSSISSNNFNTGPATTLNDLNLGTCGAQQIWISTSGPPSAVIGTDWIQWDWSFPRSFNSMTIYTGTNNGRKLTGAIIQVWDGLAWVNAYTWTGMAMGTECDYTITFPAITAARMRITKFEMIGPGQNSNPSFREIQIWEALLAPDNAGVSAITEPIGFCTGNYNIKVDIFNGGTNVINNVEVHWSIDGVLQPVIHYNTPIDTSGSVNGSVANVTLATNFAFPPGVVRRLKVWTALPNGVADTLNGNDTIYQDVAPSLSGVYTIGGANPSYATLAAAANDLNSFGVCGPVTFNIRPGTYTEQFALKNIVGSSSTNTIRFIGDSKTTTIVSFAATANNVSHTIRLNESRWVTLQNMTIRGTGITYAWPVHFLNASNCVLSNCKVEITGTGANSTSTNFIGVVMNGSEVTYNTAGPTAEITIDDNDISGGAYNIYNSNNLGSRVNYYRRNILTGAGTAAAYFNSAQTIKFLFNRITPNPSTSNDGIVLFNCNSTLSHEIKNNIISNFGNRGLYMATSAGGSSFGEIVNNIFIGGRIATPYGVYTTSSRWKYHHNTFALTNPGTGASRAFSQVAAGTGNEYINNIFYVAPSLNTTTLAAEFYATNVAGIIDYNNFHNGSGTDIVRIAGVNYNATNFQAVWPAGVGVNSISDAPVFVSTVDGHLSPAYNAPSGDPTLGTAIDVDGDSRCAGAATIGADESNFPQPPPISQFSAYDTIYVNSNTRFINTSSGDPSKQTATWYVDGVISGTDYNLDYVFDNVTSYTVALVTGNCKSSDSVVKTVSVIDPTSTPVSDFAAEKLAVPLFDYLNLFDLSKYGPTAWEWSVFPATNAHFIDPNVANPQVFFDEPGWYGICLSTENAFGKGIDSCKTNYIFVEDVVSMCSKNTSDAIEGIVTDDGGDGNNYSNTTKNCNFLINTCASSINLKFEMFTVADVSDILSVYDGKDATGTLLGTFTFGSPLPGGANGLTANSGKMYLVWSTNNAGNAAGFKARWKATSDGTLPAVADFTYNSPVYVDQEISFEALPQGASSLYIWDFDSGMGYNDQAFGEKTPYTWGIDGSYPVTLMVKNCAGADIKTIMVDVLPLPSAPVVGFTSDRVRVPVQGTVNFTDTSLYGPKNWRWEITPSNSIVFQTPANARNTSVAFYAPGFYDVKLVAANSLGADSVISTSYIEVFNYCIPAVGQRSADIGISRVRFAGIDNVSPVGQTSYTSYTETLTPQPLARGKQVDFTISRNTNIDNMNRKIWIDLNADGDFDDAGELVATERSAKTLQYQVSVQIPRTAAIGNTRIRIGTSYSNNNNQPCGVNNTGEFEDYPVQIIDDMVQPEITLNGADTLYVEQWYQFTDPGVTALDDVDGNISAQVTVTGLVDSSVQGLYLLRYNVADSALNNAAEIVRVVIVTQDVTAPVIALNGNQREFVTVNTAYNDPGAVATDYFNRNITSLMTVNNTVDTTTIGTYTIDYEVADADGNRDIQTREVVVIDDVAPVLSLNGNNIVFVEVGDPYVEPGFATSDNYYRGVDVQVNPAVINTNVTGTTLVSYVATDSSGNAAPTLQRTVIVRDTKAPVITLKGNDTVYVDVFSSYTEPGSVVNDNYCFGLSAPGDIYPNTNVLGDYLITYDVTDCEGNAATPVTRVVKVVDRIAPVIHLNGLSRITVRRWVDFNDPGVRVSDNYYPASVLDPLVQITTDYTGGTVEGEYEYCYDVTDPSLNIATRVCRIITVTENATGIAGTELKDNISIYPNPNPGRFTLEFGNAPATDVQVSITDITGKQVHSLLVKEGQVQAGIVLDHLAAGIYNLQVIKGSEIAVLKISIVK